MNCIKCGRKIADDAVFCSNCSAPPETYTNVQLRQPTARAAAPVKKKKKLRKKINYHRLTRRLTVATVVLSLLLIAVSGLFAAEIANLVKRKNDLRIREASVTLREKDLQSRDTRIAELEEELAALQKQLEKLPATPVIPLP